MVVEPKNQDDKTMAVVSSESQNGQLALQWSPPSFLLKMSNTAPMRVSCPRKTHQRPNKALAATPYERLFYPSSTFYYPTSPEYSWNTKKFLSPTYEQKFTTKRECVFCATSKATQNSCRLLRCVDKLCFQN